MRLVLPKNSAPPQKPLGEKNEAPQEIPLDYRNITRPLYNCNCRLSVPKVDFKSPFTFGPTLICVNVYDPSLNRCYYDCGNGVIVY